MTLNTRIKNVELRVWGTEIHPFKIIRVLKRKAWRELSRAELYWVSAKLDKGKKITAETAAKIDTLLLSLSEQDQKAVREHGDLSPDGQAIMAHVQALGGVTE